MPVSGQARLPGRFRAALRCRLDAVVFEDRFDRVARHVVAETLQPAADAGVIPGLILGRHAYDERCDIRFRARATGAARLRAVVLLGDEFPIPNGGWCHVTIPATSARRRRPRTLLCLPR